MNLFSRDDRFYEPPGEDLREGDLACCLVCGVALCGAWAVVIAAVVWLVM